MSYQVLPPPLDEPRWEHTMIAPTPADENTVVEPGGSLGVDAWTDDELDTHLASSSTPPIPSPPEPRPAIPLGADAWTEDELDTRLATSLPPIPPRTSEPVPLGAEAWADDELDTRLASSSSIPRVPSPPRPSEPVLLGAEAWTDDELDTRLEPDSRPREPSGELQAPRVDELDSQMPRVGSSRDHGASDRPRVTSADAPRVHSTPRGYLEHASPFDPFAPVPEPAGERGLPSIEEDEAAVSFEAVSGLYALPPLGDEALIHPSLPHAPRGSGATISDDEEDGAEARLELGEALARAISAQLRVPSETETSSAETPEDEVQEAVDRTSVQPAATSTTISQPGPTHWGLDALDRREHEDTGVDRWPAEGAETYGDASYEPGDPAWYASEGYAAGDHYGDDAFHGETRGFDDDGYPHDGSAYEADGYDEDGYPHDGSAYEADGYDEEDGYSHDGEAGDGYAYDTDDAYADGGTEYAEDYDDAYTYDAHGVAQPVQDDHTQIAVHIPMPPLEPEPETPNDAVTGFTMVMHVDDLIAAAELEASAAAGIPIPELESPTQTGHTVQIDLRAGLAWTADPAVSPAEATWATTPSPVPAPASAHDEHAPLDLDDLDALDDLDIPTAIVPPATTEIAEESSVPRLSKDLQAALARVRRRNKPAATAKETPDEASPEAATEPEPEAAPRKDSRQRRRERRASRRWGNDSPELVELYRAALAQLDPEP
ncbi:MAG: hypothetical protein KC501_37350 [Myxococcales bacterium]|nr:hypothetical protein [Myxococcales bacterium]